MSTPWRATTLSVDPPSYQMGHEDVESFAFDAGEAISDATAVLIDLATKTVPTGPTVSIGNDGRIATVTVGALTRDVTYELAVTFARADGREWSRTLVLEAVA